PIVVCVAYRALRRPHPFPTRRSSDLSVRQRDILPSGIVKGRRFGSTWITDEKFPTGIEVVFRSRARRRIKGSGRARESRLRNPRSEEHTSELQSRVDIVCRLLLEKKK